MKKPKDEMRKEYKASDFKKLERGRFYAEVSKGTAIALLDPVVAKAFPTSEAVNEALHGLLEIAAQASRITSPSTGRRGKRRVAAR
jgi:hypothetical protein